MEEKTLEIKNKTGLHANPAGRFVKIVSQFNSKVTVAFEGKEVNAKDVMAVMGLGVAKGNKITIKAEGEDSKKAINEIADFIENDMIIDDD